MKKMMILFPIMLAIQGSTPTPESRKFHGIAYDLKTGNMIYSENHTEYYSNGRHLRSIVLYTDPAGRVFARKDIDFSRSETAPDFTLVDYRDGYTEGSIFTAAGFDLFGQRNRSAEMKRRVLIIPEPAVVDGGFDYFVRQNWEKLAAGERISVNFAVSIERDYFRFFIVKTGNGEVNGRRALQLRLQIENVFLRSVVDPIDISYDVESKRLLLYRGMSNINNERGKSYRASVVFDYASQ